MDTFNKEEQQFNTLLRHTGEFIANFELVAEKMQEWQMSLEFLQNNQKQNTEEELTHIHEILNQLRDVFTQAGVARFRLMCDYQEEKFNALTQHLEETHQNLMLNFHEELKKFEETAQKINEKIHSTLETSINKAEYHLQQYDPEHFHRIANESCHTLFNLSEKTLHRGGRLLESFRWRQLTLSFFITLFTSICIGLYINDELPWEHHETAQRERHAGQALLHAWPHLSQNEQEKIIHHVAHQT